MMLLLCSCSGFLPDAVFRIPGTIEPCDFDEIASGLWAYAETALEGRTDSDAMALAAIWGCEKVCPEPHFASRAIT